MTPDIPGWLRELKATFATADQVLIGELLELGQAHLFAHWRAKSSTCEDQARQLAQLRTLDAQYPGGLRTYVRNARKLLSASRSGENPYAGYVPKVPSGQRLETASPEFDKAAARGMAEIDSCAFVLVAGGLGERLGYSGIKIALPAETLTGRSFVELYIQQILALQTRANRGREATVEIPLTIMTSGDTDEATKGLLAEHDNFGMASGQVQIIKQEKVPSLSDNDAHFTQSSTDPHLIETKPHGHGDVHALLHRSGMVAKWLAAGKTHVGFFQDTNALVFNAMVPTLGVSLEQDFDFNTITVPRAAGEAAGGIVSLTNEEKSLTVNVEYNQLDPLLRATVDSRGDVADETGFSPYPGNTNAFVVKLSSYAQTLAKSEGAIPEFVNPKYADTEKTQFKKPTRLECMMQDYPKLLESNAKVGFTQFERADCFSAVKNNVADACLKAAAGLPPESASTGEAEFYGMYRTLLQRTGSKVQPSQTHVFGGVPVNLFPQVVIYPSFALTPSELKTKTSNIRISGNSTLVLDGPDIHIDDLELDGALWIRAVPGARVRIRGLTVCNKGVHIRKAPPDAPEHIAARGFEYETTSIKTIIFNEPGDYTVSE